MLLFFSYSAEGLRCFTRITWSCCTMLCFGSRWDLIPEEIPLKLMTIDILTGQGCGTGVFDVDIKYCALHTLAYLSSVVGYWSINLSFVLLQSLAPFISHQISPDTFGVCHLSSVIKCVNFFPSSSLS